MAHNIVLEALESTSFKKTQQTAQLVESLSGGGIVKKLQRLIRTPQVYIPYLLMVRVQVYRRKSVPVTLFWGRTIHVPMQDYDSLALRAFGFAGGTEAELKLTKYFAKHLGKEGVFYDIGANYGFFSYLAAELCKEVHAFEPMPEIAQVLRVNTANDSNVVLSEVAISNTHGEADLHVSESSGLSTINASTVGTHSYTYDSSKTVRVPTRTLDEYVESNTKPTVLKIDVEGAEEQVIMGATTFLKEYAPIIAMEVWGAENGGEISMKAVQRLRDLGYASFSIDTNGDIQEVEGDLSAISSLTGGDNFIFKKV